MKVWYKPKFGIHRVTNEVTLMVNSQGELRSLAMYLLEIADLPQGVWDKFGHEHYKDSKHKLKDVSNYDFIVTKDNGT